MKLKDKILIGFIIIIIFVLAFVIRGNAAMVATNLIEDTLENGYIDQYDLAVHMAMKSIFGIPANELYGKYVGQAPASVYFKSAMCMYHQQSTLKADESLYYIYNVLDFKYDDSTGKLVLYNNGTKVQNTNKYTWMLAKELEKAWKNSPYESSSISNKYKNDAMAAFYLAREKNALGTIGKGFYSNAEESGYYYSEMGTENIGQEMQDYKKITKVATSKATTVTVGKNITAIGPIKVNYGGKIKNIIIKSGNNSIYYGGGKNIGWKTLADFEAGSGSWNLDCTKIPSNTEVCIGFYNRDFTVGNSVNIKIEQKELKYYEARLILTGKEVANAQQIGIYASKECTKNAAVEYDVFNLKINKKDDSGNALAGAKFKIYVPTYKKWLKNNNTLTSNSDEAKVWKTDANGSVTIQGLSGDYKYRLAEVEVPSGCASLDKQVELGMTATYGTTSLKVEYASSYKAISIQDIVFNKQQPNNTVNIINIGDDDFKIIINKLNESSESINGAKFKLYIADSNGSWLGYNESTGEYVYDSNVENAYVWETDNGVVQIDNLSKDYRYAICEVEPPEGYLGLKEQVEAGMNVTINDKKIEPKYFEGFGICLGIISHNTYGSNVVINANNIQDYLDISGIIWEDFKGTKTDEYDGLYNTSSEDKLYTGEVKISLVNSKGDVVQSVTTTNGNYKITTPITVATSMDENQIKSKLEGYYLKFEYISGYTEADSKISYYSTVIPTIVENGSKAIPNSSDSNTSGKAYIYKLSDYVNGTNYVATQNTSTHELKNMNMGLVKIENKYDHNIEQTLAYVKVVINGYTYTYEYGGTGNTAATAAPKVQYDNGWAYTRPIYPSDIAYSKINSWNDSSLKVYVVYRIDIKDIDPEGNASLTKEGTTTQVSYVEVDLKVDSLTNTYDTDRYELEKEYDKSTNSDFGDWDDNESTGVATYKGTKLNNTIKPNETRTVYIQFKVKDSALEDLLTKGTTYETKATVASAKAYHKYWKSYFAWNDSKVSTLVKEDKTTKTVTKNADSIYLKLQLGTERNLTGKVFEDNKISTNGEALGNGKYDSGENNISNVKVDLLLEDKTTIATLYKKNGVNYDESPATTKTNADGTYSIDGVTPGKYYVRFTYGDGTYSIADYKSTIVSEDNIKTALKTGDENWYKKVSDIEHSTAVDNLEQRGQYNSDTTSRNTIEANTALISVGVENDNEGDFVSVTVTNDADGHKETVNGINFGIIKQPNVLMESDKVVTYIKIINTQGNIIAEGNPATQNIKYVSGLDRENHLTTGSSYVKVEINENELYGSTLEIQYSITVQNKSDVNYYEDMSSSKYGYYYKYGEKTSDSKEVTYTPEVVYDYIDSSVKSESVKLVSEPPYVIDIITISGANEKEKELVKNVKDNITGCDYEYLIKITGWNKELKSIQTQNEDGTQKHSTDNTKEVVDFKVSRLLSVEDSDLVVSNVAQVVNFKTPESPLVPQPEPQEPSEEVIVTVIPPTGEDTLSIMLYIITSIVAGAVIVLGVIIIKKKVLNK